MIKTNKKGMTLVELMVYIVLAAFLLAPIIMLVQNSSVNMARDASNVSLRMTGREILNILYDDLRNTGYKLNPENFNAMPGASYDDGSSFMPGNKSGGDYYDTLTVLMGRLSTTGGWARVDTIVYKVNADKELTRKINRDDPIKLARNVEALKFRYSIDLGEWYDAFTDVKKKDSVQYIKVIMVTKDPKKLAASKTTRIKLIDGVSGVGGIDTTFTDGALYERHEIVVPIPNNGLFPN